MPLEHLLHINEMSWNSTCYLYSGTVSIQCTAVGHWLWTHQDTPEFECYGFLALKGNCVIMEPHCNDKLNQTSLKSQSTPCTSASQVSYGVSVEIILVKINNCCNRTTLYWPNKSHFLFQHCIDKVNPNSNFSISLWSITPMMEDPVQICPSTATVWNTFHQHFMGS